MKNSFNIASSGARTSTRRSQLVWTAALFGIALLLLAMAVLQYRWNMQIRRATEIRVGADLESAMMKWHLDLYGELSTICIGLQVGPDSGANDQWDRTLLYFEARRACLQRLRRHFVWEKLKNGASFEFEAYVAKSRSDVTNKP